MEEGFIKSRGQRHSYVQRKEQFKDEKSVIKTESCCYSLNTLELVENCNITPHLTTRCSATFDGYKVPIEFRNLCESIFHTNIDMDHFLVYLLVSLNLTDQFKVFFVKSENTEGLELLNDVLRSIFKEVLTSCRKRPFIVLPKGKRTDKKEFLELLTEKSIFITLNQDDVLDPMIAGLSKGVIVNEEEEKSLYPNIIINSNVENKISNNVDDKFFTLPGIKTQDSEFLFSELRELFSYKSYQNRILTYILLLLKDSGIPILPRLEHLVIDPIKLFWNKIAPRYSDLKKLASSDTGMKLDSIYRNHFIPFTQDIGYSRNITKDEFCIRITSLMKQDGYSVLITKKNRTTIILGLSLQKSKYKLSSFSGDMEAFNPVQIANKVVF